MDSDLHWYVEPEHRKQGYLTNAMKESILPYLFDEGEIRKELQLIKTK